MFENLQEKLQRAFKSLRGQARLTEENIARGAARNSPRAARSRRQLQSGQGADRPHTGQGRRPGSADRAFSGRAGHQDRARRTGRDPRQRHGAHEVRLAAAHGRAHGRTARFRQDHHFGQAGELVQDGRASSAAGFGGRVPSRGARAVESCGAGREGADLRRRSRRGATRKLTQASNGW